MIDEQAVERAGEQLSTLRNEVRRRIVGHEQLVDGILACLLASGHALIEGMPGLGKTMLVKTLSDAMDLEFSRNQFTPDLMPADIIGTQMVMQDESGRRHFQFQPGPVFTQFLLADEINRATPKTQSALLEAMEEKRITVGRDTHPLQEPFMVLATQNPIEMEGTYPLPEAQLDRFLLKLNADYPSATELSQIIDRSAGGEQPGMGHVLSSVALLQLRVLVREVVIAQHVKDFAIRIVLATHPTDDLAAQATKLQATKPEATKPEATQRYVRHGASPRGALAIVLIAKAYALFAGRMNVSYDDIIVAAKPALRHRILLNFEGEAEGYLIDDLIDEIIRDTPVTERAA